MCSGANSFPANHSGYKKGLILAWQLSQDTRDGGESQTNQEEHRATLSDEQLEQSSLVLPGGNWFWCQGNRVQGACWIDRTGRAEGNSLGEGENQTELAACCTGPAQSFKVRNTEKTPVNSSITQHRTVSTYWKTSEVRTNFPDYTTSLLHLRHSSSLRARSGVG